MWLIQRTVKMVSYISGVAINLSRSDSKSWIFAPASLTCFDNSILSFFSCNKSKELVRFGPIKKLFFVCGHRQKTKELLELLLFFSICLISYLKEIIAKKIIPTGNQAGVHEHASQALYQLSSSNIDIRHLEDYPF